MRTKQMKAFILAAIFAFESMVAGYVSVSAQTMPQNSIIEAVEPVQIASETVDAEMESIESETVDREVENVESETADAEVDIAAETATVLYSGTDGALSWSIDTDGHLTVSGNGDYEKRTQFDSDMGWLVYKDKIKSATVNVTGITNTSYMFNGCNNLENVDLSGLYMSDATDTDIDMQYMFHLCNNLTSLDLSGLDTSKVTNMDHMFYNCKKLESLDLSGFQTGNVVSMNSMFYACSSLTSLDLDNFNTANVKYMQSMFHDCSKLVNLSVSRFDTGNVENMENMFYSCESLTSLDLSNFDTTNVTNMSYMFGYCSSLTSLDISNFNTENVTNMSGMFVDCNNLNTIYAPENKSSENMALPTVENCTWTYQPTGENVKVVTLAGTYVKVYGGIDGALNWSIDTDGHLTVSGNGDYEQRRVSDGGDIQWTGEKGWLLYKDKIKSATVNVSEIKDTSYMFYGCSNLESVDVSGLDTSNVTYMGHMFYGCSNLESLDLSGFNTTNVENMIFMFYDCSSLKNLNVTGFDTSKVTSMRWMFFGCSSLESLDVDGFNTMNVTDMQAMFGFCSSLKSLDITEFDTSKVTNMAYMFSGCSSLESLDISKFDTMNVTDMAGVFNRCNKLHTIHAPENKSTVDMKLPVEEDCTWTHVPTGEYVTVVKKAGTYVKGAVVKDESNQEEEKPVVGDNTDPEEEKPVVGDKPEPEEKKPVVEKDTETKKDGSVVTTEKTTYPEGNVSMTIISTSKDKKKQTRVDMEIDAQKNLTSAAIDVSKKISKKTMTINLKELKKMVDQIEKCNVEYVHPLADGIDAESILAEDVLEGSTENITWSDELYVTAKKANISIKVTAKDNKGKDKYSLSIQKKDLTQKKFVVYSSDKKGSPVMTNPKSNYVKVNAKKDMTIKIASKGNYQLQNNKDAAKTNQKIMKTVTPAKTKVTVKPGSSTKFALSAKCNKANISKITYKADSSKVSVAKSGKISAKSSGTTKVTANVTMKNGAKKSIKMKVSVS